MKTITPIYLNADFYKLSHREQYPKGTTKVYSTLTPRSNKFAPWSDNVVVFGIQYFIKEYLIERFNNEFFNVDKNEVINTYKTFIENTLGKDNVYTKHLEDLHDLGYLPIEIKALPEGTLAPIKCPILTIENTHNDFFWLTNFIETILSTTIWQPITSATLAYQYRKVLTDYAEKTSDSLDFVDWQGHDFSMRGMSSEQTAMASGMGHLLSFKGSDTIPAIFGLHKYYNASLDFNTGSSISATEHSVMCAYGDENELDLFKHLLTNVYPEGIFSVVSDTWDFWKVVTEYLPALKDIILNRNGKIVIRPDSGDPIEILAGKEFVEVETLRTVDLKQLIANHGKNGEIVVKEKGEYKHIVLRSENNILVQDYNPTPEDLGLIEMLWRTFGGNINSKGYKVLDEHIGAIYGDSITLERATEILRRLEVKGFASTNVVFGIGSFSYQYHTRDTFGFAVKATYAIVDGEERLLFKDPKTDDGTKRSQRGKVSVQRDNNNNIFFEDGLTNKDIKKLEKSILKTIFLNGELIVNYSLEEIRKTLQEQ